jgi:hypothetical protein
LTRYPDKDRLKYDEKEDKLFNYGKMKLLYLSANTIHIDWKDKYESAERSREIIKNLQEERARAKKEIYGGKRIQSKNPCALFFEDCGSATLSQDHQERHSKLESAVGSWKALDYDYNEAKSYVEKCNDSNLTEYFDTLWQNLS